MPHMLRQPPDSGGGGLRPSRMSVGSPIFGAMGIELDDERIAQLRGSIHGTVLLRGDEGLAAEEDGAVNGATQLRDALVVKFDSHGAEDRGSHRHAGRA